MPESRVAPLATVAPDVRALRQNTKDATVTWIGHATLLVQLDGVTFLTDPTWAERSGPFGGLVGVRRYTPPPVSLENLPPIDFVLISHDHYDHLDEPTVRRLAKIFNPTFVVPLGIGAWLADRGITNAVELNWGESVTIGGRLLFALQGDRRRAGALRPGRPAHRLLHATLDCPPCPYLARRSAPGLDRPAGGTVHWHPLGHLRSGPGALRRAAQTHRSGGGAERAGSGGRVDTQAG